MISILFLNFFQGNYLAEFTYFEKDWVLSNFFFLEFILGKQIQIHIHLNSTLLCEQILSNDNFTLFLLKPSYFPISMLLRNSHVWADSFLSEIQQEEHLIQLEIKFSTHFREADCLRVSMVTAYFLGLKGRHFSSDIKSKIKEKNNVQFLYRLYLQYQWSNSIEMEWHRVTCFIHCFSFSFLFLNWQTRIQCEISITQECASQDPWLQNIM